MLPLEVYQQIFAHVENDNDLKTLRLVSKSLAQEAERILFQDMTIHLPSHSSSKYVHPHIINYLGRSQASLNVHRFGLRVESQQVPDSHIHQPTAHVKQRLIVSLVAALARMNNLQALSINLPELFPIDDISRSVTRHHAPFQFRLQHLIYHAPSTEILLYILQNQSHLVELDWHPGSFPDNSYRLKPTSLPLLRRLSSISTFIDEVMGGPGGQLIQMVHWHTRKREEGRYLHERLWERMIGVNLQTHLNHLTLLVTQVIPCPELAQQLPNLRFLHCSPEESSDVSHWLPSRQFPANLITKP